MPFARGDEGGGLRLGVREEDRSEMEIFAVVLGDDQGWEMGDERRVP